MNGDPPKYVHVLVLETKDVTLFDKRVSVDVIRDFEMRRSSWIIWVGSESNDKCLIRGTRVI